MGRVWQGKGMGWIFQPSPHLHPWRGLVGYPPSWILVFEIGSEFELRSMMLVIIDLAFHHSHNITLGSKNVKEHGQGSVIYLQLSSSVHANLFSFFKVHPYSNLLPPGLSPPMRDVGHPMSMSMDLGRACGFWWGGRHQRRPMVWYTHEVCETASCTQHNANIAPWAPFWHYSPLLHLPRIQKQAGGRYLWRFSGTHMSSTSLASKSELEVDLYDILTPASSTPSLPPSPLHTRWRACS